MPIKYSVLREYSPRFKWFNGFQQNFSISSNLINYFHYLPQHGFTKEDQLSIPDYTTVACQPIANNLLYTPSQVENALLYYATARWTEHQTYLYMSLTNQNGPRHVSHRFQWR